MQATFFRDAKIDQVGRSDKPILRLYASNISTEVETKTLDSRAASENWHDDYKKRYESGIRSGVLIEPDHLLRESTQEFVSHRQGLQMLRSASIQSFK